MSGLEGRTWIEPLSTREIQILGLISEGLSNREISRILHLTPETIKWYNKQIYGKLGASNRAQATKIAAERGFLDLKKYTDHAEVNRKIDNLPAQITSFVGRRREIAEIKQLLKLNRLVVITGAGGSGKTRLAIQVVEQLAANYRDGIWLVELASLSDPRLLVETIAQALKIPMSAAQTPSAALKRFLARKHLLLLLDNFEHLLEASPFVGELLAAAPQLTVLCTSRERLHLYGEQDYPLQPLDLPHAIDQEPIEKLLSYEAIDLFVQRARSAQPNLEISAAELPAIIQISTRLDGLPLAIELAASQAKVFSLAVLAKQLEESLDLLPPGPRDMPARQQTLNATIEWSERLLGPRERDLFIRLAVFSGGATLNAIEHVCSAGLRTKFITLLSTLVDKNLVLARESKDGELRFTMLETIHAYASQRLSLSEKAQHLRQIHAAYYTEFADRASQELESANSITWSAKLRLEQENLRSVIAWSLESDEIQYALRLAKALFRHWSFHDGQAEGRYWCELILNKELDAPPDLLAGVFYTAGILAYDFGDIESSVSLLQRSLELYQQSGDQRGAALTNGYLAVISGVDSTEDLSQNIEMVRQSLEVFRKLDDQASMALAYNFMGSLARLNEDHKAAQAYYEQSAGFAQLSGDRLSEAIQYLNLGSLAYNLDQYHESAELIQRAIGAFREFYPVPVYCLINGLGLLAGPVARLGDPEKAARLLGAADAGLDLLGVPHEMLDGIDIDKFQISIRQVLGAEAFQQAWQAGYEMSTQEALDFALSKP